MNSTSGNVNVRNSSVVICNLIRQVLKKLDKNHNTLQMKRMENISKKQGSNGSSKHSILKSLGTTLVISLIFVNLCFYSFPVVAKRNDDTGNIKVYWEEECIREVSSIDWGSVKPGDLKSITLYIYNIGRKALTLELSKSVNPEKAATDLELQWDYTGENVYPGATIDVTLTLMVSEDIEGVNIFNLEILITGREVIVKKEGGKGARANK